VMTLMESIAELLKLSRELSIPQAPRFLVP
jgi:hypothetical protein